MPSSFLTFQQIISKLNEYWQEQGCILIQPLDMEVGAGTFHPATFIRSIGPEPWSCAYVQPSRRPADGRYGDNPNRLQHYYQYQVLIKPSPSNLQQLYLGSLKAVEIDCNKHDIRFVEDNWESPTLGSWGLGWEVWLDGMEITQFTYFQQTGGLECNPISGELTYGLERLAMYIQNVHSVYDIIWTTTHNPQKNLNKTIYYRDVFHQNEVEQSTYNFAMANVANLFQQFEQSYQLCTELVEKKLPLPAYDQVMKASHLFNLLDARKAISITERQRYIFRVRTIASQVAQCYQQVRENLNFPLGNCSRQLLEKNLSKENETILFTAKKQTGTLLFELGCEELPTNEPHLLSQELLELVKEGLKNHDINFADEKIFSTPKRLAFQLEKVQSKQKMYEKIRKGPKENSPNKAIDGFANSCGVNREQLTIKAIDNHNYWVYREQNKGENIAQILQIIMPNVWQKLSIKKRMYWGNLNFQFSRPVHWLVCLFNEQIIPLTCFAKTANNITYPHRFYNEQPIVLKHAEDYQKTLLAQKVMVCFEQRKSSIEQQIKQVAEQVKGKANIDPELLQSVTSLTEYPTALLGSFPQKFLSLPDECLDSTLKKHQKYFTLVDEKNQLLPYFITISNNPQGADKAISKNIINGNERVIIPRLEDAEFFWQNDQKIPLEKLYFQLEKIIFAKGLGNLQQKNERIKNIANFLAEKLSVDKAIMQQLCQLSKCDLVTDMVNEFPELQGIVGFYLAQKQGLDNHKAKALKEQYQPRFSIDAIPQTAYGIALSIADKIDNICGFFAIGKKPQGSGDPFALRRSALGIMRIMAEQPCNFDLEELIEITSKQWQNQIKVPNDLKSSVLDFLWNRLKFWHTQEKQYPVQLCNAVFAVKPKCPYNFVQRIEALKKISQQAEVLSLSETNHRIKNILKNQLSPNTTLVKESLLNTQAEKTLWQSYKQISQQVKNSTDYHQALTLLCQLSQPVEKFFNEVMIMDENAEIRQNRLNLIRLIRQQFLEIADISLLQI